MTKFGIVLPQHDSGPEELIGAAVRAEEEGLHSVWLFDHVVARAGPTTRPILEGWTSLATVASETSTIGVGTLVTRVPMRNPRVLAAMAETVERIAPGRLTVGLGIGDSSNAHEHLSYGIPFPRRQERMQMLDKAITHLRDVTPATRVWVGGGSDDLMERAVRVDGWNLWGEPSVFIERRSRLAGTIGPEMPECSWAGPLPDLDTLTKLVAGGADHVIVPTGAKNASQRISQLAELSREVNPDR